MAHAATKSNGSVTYQKDLRTPVTLRVPTPARIVRMRSTSLTRSKDFQREPQTAAAVPAIPRKSTTASTKEATSVPHGDKPAIRPNVIQVAAAKDKNASAATGASC